MRPHRSAPAAARTSARGRRGVALATLGTLALVGGTPAVALASEDAAPAADGEQPTVDPIVLPALEQVDQVVPADDAPVVDDAVGAPVADDATDVPSPDGEAEGPAADAPADVPAGEQDDVPAAPRADVEIAAEDDVLPLPDAVDCSVDILGCYGTGKVRVNASTPDGASAAGTVLEIDHVGTGPEPEGTITLDEWGSTGGYWSLPQGVSATVRVVSVPAGTMLAGPASTTVGPCLRAEVLGIWCDYDVTPQIVRAYRVLEMGVADESGAAVGGVTVELWGAAGTGTPVPAPEMPPEVPPVLLRVAPEPEGLELLGTATSDAAGRVDFGRVVPAAYQLRVTGVPTGYVQPSAVVPAALGEVGTTAEADVAFVAPLVLRAVAAPAPVRPVPAVPVPAVPVPAAPVVEAVAPVVAAPAAPTARGARTATLAVTGTDPADLAGVAAALVLLGAGALVAVRRSGRRV